jgi:hypothetical protein
MSGSVVVEVKILDFLDNQIIQKSISGESDTVKIFNLLYYLEEQVGGAICFSHYCLPELGSRYVNDQWTIEIDCCCKEQSRHIEERLKKIFPNYK